MQCDLPIPHSLTAPSPGRAVTATSLHPTTRHGVEVLRNVCQWTSQALGGHHSPTCPPPVSFGNTLSVFGAGAGLSHPKAQGLGHPALDLPGSQPLVITVCLSSRVPRYVDQGCWDPHASHPLSLRSPLGSRRQHV